MTATSARINPADHLPDYVSSTQAKGLLADVDIWRDQWGIPHIRGGSYQDAFCGLGFEHAQDRLWQMEALLRLTPAQRLRLADLLLDYFATGFVRPCASSQ